ncbi:hypothetical protein [Rhodococcus daqingensis]|uniref:Uncharacterized protein n=1 Tax=Rhodococcus daqingensis TaxID=2479363 RepID=A0ABW2RRS5_9NOCA
MTRTEIVPRSTLRGAVFGQQSDDALTSRMKPHVPPTGMTPARVTAARAVPRSALRLIDSRILSTALRFLDQDPCPLLLSGLKRFQALTAAARVTAAAPGREEVVMLVDPYRVISVHRPEVALLIDGTEVARIAFDLRVAFGMGKTTVAVRLGAIDAVDCEAGAVSVDLSVPGGEHLLHGEAEYSVRRTVRPPIMIPVGPRPERRR